MHSAALPRNSLLLIGRLRTTKKGCSQTFWLSLLQKVYRVEVPDRFITFENQIMIDYTSFIDGFILSTLVLIEQKSLDNELNKFISAQFSYVG